MFDISLFFKSVIQFDINLDWYFEKKLVLHAFKNILIIFMVIIYEWLEMILKLSIEMSF